MKRQISTKRRSAKKYGKKPFTRYFPKIKRAMTRSSSTPNLSQKENSGSLSELSRKPSYEDLQDDIEIQESDVKILRQSLREVERRRMSRECEITLNKIKIFRKISQEDHCPDPEMVCEEIIVPKKVPIREGDLDGTIVHVTKDEDILPINE